MYQHPGVYIEHVPSGVLAIEAASTSVAAFIGTVGRGNLNEPVFITAASQYATNFGPLGDTGTGIRDLGATPDEFGFAVNAFFQNGGNKAYIVPVGRAGGQAAFASIADPLDPLKAFYFTASSPGAWSNGMTINLSRTDTTDASLGYVLTVGVPTDGKNRTLERYTDTRLAESDSRYLATKVNGTSLLTHVEHLAIAAVGGTNRALPSGPLADLDPTTLVAATPLSLSIGATAVTVNFNGAATTLEQLATVVQTQARGGAGAPAAQAGFLCQVTRDRSLLLIAGGNDGTAVTVTGGVAAANLQLDPTMLLGRRLTTATLPAAIAGTTLTITSGTTTRAVNFTAVTTDLTVAATAINGVMTPALAGFIAEVVGTRLRLRVTGGHAADVVSVTGTAADLLGLAAGATGPVAAISYPATFDPANGTTVTLMGGVDPVAADTAAYQLAFDKLRDYRDVSIIVLPGKHWIKGGDNSVIGAAITHAEYMQNRMVIIDPPDPKVSDELTSPKAFLDLGAPNSPYSALYYPWLIIANPAFDPDTAGNKPRTFTLGPSGYAAGMWARIDGQRGVWKAPAGLEADVRGTQGPNILIGNEYQDNLNEWGVNCIRNILGPTVIWGARTLATKSKPDYRYVPVRRTQSMIGESLYNALQAVVFEPNDHRLWSSLRASATNFMDGLFRSGAFQGEKASDAYFVRCGLGSTMTQGDIDAGIVRLVVGFAALKPAEFVVVQVQQIVGQTA